MDVFYNYFIPAICILLFTLLPIYFIRIVFFIRKSHFIDETLTLKVSMYMHIFIYAMFIVQLFFYIIYIDVLVFYIFGIAVLMIISLLIGYRQRFQHMKRHKYSVIYSTYQNREAFQNFLDQNKYNDTDITDGSFSHVTRIKFNNLSNDEISNRFDKIRESGLVYRFTSLKGYAVFAFNLVMFFSSIFAYIIFFAYLPRLGY